LCGPDYDKEATPEHHNEELLAVAEGALQPRLRDR
jgi:hypothetical protein